MKVIVYIQSRIISEFINSGGVLPEGCYLYLALSSFDPVGSMVQILLDCESFLQYKESGLIKNN